MCECDLIKLHFSIEGNLTSWTLKYKELKFYFSSSQRKLNQAIVVKFIKQIESFAAEKWKIIKLRQPISQRYLLNTTEQQSNSAFRFFCHRDMDLLSVMLSTFKMFCSNYF
jgi:hypothetical protein